MKLGELFVDLGFHKGNALNDLTNFSIRFLALGKLAQEVANAFDGLFGDVMRYGVELSNTNKLTGISTNLMQQMKYKADQLGVSYDSWLSSLKGIQKANADIMMGQGNYAGFQKLGISMNTIRNPAELLAEVMQKISSLEPTFRRSILAEVGVQEEAYLLYTEKARAMRGTLLLSEKDIANQKELNKEWNYLTNTIGAAWNRLLLDNNQTFREAIKSVQNLVDEFLDLKEATGSWIDAIDQALEKWSKDSVFASILNGLNETSKWIFEKLKNTQNPNIPTLEEFTSGKRKKESNQDYFNRTDSMYNYGQMTPIVNYTDNSQTTINTSDGVNQYREIADTKSREMKNKIGDVEYIYKR